MNARPALRFPARAAVLLAPTLVVAALVAATLFASLAVAGCSGPNRSVPTLHDVRDLLTGHAAAVRHHDRTSFEHDLDPGGNAAGFRHRQLSAFDNLVKLPLASWSYRVEGRTDSRAAERAAGKRFGSAALIVRISLRYAYVGVDRVPTRHDLWWTFVRTDGRVVIAADDSLRNAGGVSWAGPWDFGPLQVLRGPHSLVLAHPDHAGAMREVADDVESAVPAVSAVWGPSWSQDVAVVIPSSATELTAQVGETADASLEIAALAMSDGQDPLSGDVFGQRLIVNPDALGRLSPIGRRITIRHEVTHIAAARDTGPASPQWLIEGFAEYVGNLDSGQPVPTAAGELRADVRHGRVPTALPTAAEFASAGESAQAYEGAWLACRLIAQQAGAPGLVRLYRLVGASPFLSDVAVDRALRRVVHENGVAFTARWRAYLISELG